MKTMMIATLMVLTATSAQAAVKNCGTASNKNTLQLLSSAADEIKEEAGKDARVSIDRNTAENKQLNAIGVVTLPEMKSYGTGFLVDSCHVLTNKHVVFPNLAKAKNGAKVAFSAGQTNSISKPFSQTLVEGKVVAFGNFDKTKASRNSDWAVIRLSKPIGKEVGTVPMYQMDPKKLAGRQVITAGYPGAKTQNGKDLSKLWGDLNCKVIGTEIYGYLIHTCQATGGQSGSPVLAKGHDGKLYAVGMISGDHGFSLDRVEDPDKANAAVNFFSGKDVDVVSEGDKIKTAIQNDSCE